MPPTFSIPHFSRFPLVPTTAPRFSSSAALSIKLTAHSGCKTCEGQERGQGAQPSQPFLRLPTRILARPLSGACRRLPRDLPTALRATEGAALPPERSVYATPPPPPASCGHSPASWSLGWVSGWPDRPWAATAASPGPWSRHCRPCPLTSQGRAETLARASCFTAGP